MPRTYQLQALPLGTGATSVFVVPVTLKRVTVPTIGHYITNIYNITEIYYHKS